MTELEAFVDSSNIRFLIYTQTITVGVNFINEKFKRHVSIYSNFQIECFEQYQQLYRSRCAVEFYHIQNLNQDKDRQKHKEAMKRK
jgi:hypothetical protein